MKTQNFKSLMMTAFSLFALIFAQSSLNAQFVKPAPTNPTIHVPQPKPTKGSLPDLIITSIVMERGGFVAGQPMGKIKITVKNIGRARALGTDVGGGNGYMIDNILSVDPAAPVRFASVPRPYVFNEDMLLRGGRISNTKTLAPGESKTYIEDNTAIPVNMGELCKRGYLYFGSIVDSGRKVRESNEKNNTSFQTIKLKCKTTTQKRPDLVIEKIRMASSIGQPGQRFSKVFVTVKNIGGAPAQGTDINPASGYILDIILSSDQNAPVRLAPNARPGQFPEDVLIPNGRVKRTKTLAPGASHTYVLSNLLLPAKLDLHNPCGMGFFFMGAVADPANKVAESNERNNTGFTKFKLVCNNK